MSSRVTRDHHSLTRNLKLNGKYISNDGGSDGISIDNYGTVLVGGQDTSGRVALNVVADENPYLSIYGEGDNYSALKIYEAGGVTQDDYFDINVQHHGATTISTVDAAANAANLTFQIDGDTIIDRNVSNTSAGTYKGFSVDFDKTGSSSSNNTLYALIIDADNTTATSGINTLYGIRNTPTLTHASDGGTTILYGLSQIVTGSTNGSSTATGITQTVTGADTQIGFNQKVDDGGIDIKLKSSANTSDYFTISTTTNGATLLSTTDADDALAHLTLDADGELNLDAGLTDDDFSGILFKQSGTTFGSLSAHHGASIFLLAENAGASLVDYFKIKCEANGATTIETVDDNAAAATLTFDPDGKTIFKIDDGNDDDIQILRGSTISHSFYSENGAQNLFKIYEPDSTDDHFAIDVQADASTTILTFDNNAAGGHLTLDPDGEVRLTPVTEVRSDAPLKIKEAANAVADTAAYGQLWVKTATPNELYFTTDAGNDIQLTSGTSIAGGSGGGTTTRYDGFAVGGLTAYLTSTTNYYFNYYAGYYYWSGSDSSPQTLSYSHAAAFQWVAPETCTLEEIVVTSRVTNASDDFSVYVYAYPLANNTTLWELSDLNGHLVGSITGISPTSASTVRRIKKTFTANNQIVKGTGLLCMLKKDAHSVSQRHYINVSPRVKYQWQNQKSALFNGTDQAFYLDQHANLLAAGYPNADMTFSAWINADDISIDGATRAIWYWGGYGESSGNNHRMSCSIKNRRLRCFNEYGSGSNEDHSADTDLNADTWYHVACVLSGTTLKFYVNGSADGDATLGTLPDGGTSAGGTQMKAVIGAAGVNTTGGGLTGYWDGHIHNLAIYVGRALSSSAIAAIYNSGTPTDLKEIATNYVQADIDALMLWFTFDEVSGGEVVDRANGLVTATNENTVTTESVVPS